LLRLTSLRQAKIERPARWWKTSPSRRTNGDTQEEVQYEVERYRSQAHDGCQAGSRPPSHDDRGTQAGRSPHNGDGAQAHDRREVDDAPHDDRGTQAGRSPHNGDGAQAHDRREVDDAPHDDRRPQAGSTQARCSQAHHRREVDNDAPHLRGPQAGSTQARCSQAHHRREVDNDAPHDRDSQAGGTQAHHDRRSAQADDDRPHCRDPQHQEHVAQHDAALERVGAPQIANSEPGRLAGPAPVRRAFYGFYTKAVRTAD
jgi:hypothetical protein